MENLIETIRIAVAIDATDEQRAAGVKACREIVATLEPPEAIANAVAVNRPPLPPLAQMLSILRNVPSEQLLDLAIHRLRAPLPAGTTVATPPPALRFHLLPVPTGGGGK